jgi:hypothetical protein
MIRQVVAVAAHHSPSRDGGSGRPSHRNRDRPGGELHHGSTHFAGRLTARAEQCHDRGSVRSVSARRGQPGRARTSPCCALGGRRTALAHVTAGGRVVRLLGGRRWRVLGTTSSTTRTDHWIYSIESDTYQILNTPTNPEFYDLDGMNTRGTSGTRSSSGGSRSSGRPAVSRGHSPTPVGLDLLTIDDISDDGLKIVRGTEVRSRHTTSVNANRRPSTGRPV